MLFCGAQFGDVIDKTRANIAPCFSLEAVGRLDSNRHFSTCFCNVHVFPVNK